MADYKPPVKPVDPPKPAPAKGDLPADAFKACAAYLATGDDGKDGKGKAAGKACCAYAKTQLDRPDLPRRPAHHVPVMSAPGLAMELANRAESGCGSHEWDAIHAALCAHFPE